MKKIHNKMIAFAVAVLMIASMIPAGMVSISALDTGAATVSIGSVADWEEVASADSTFAGQTVELIADIDFAGTVAPMLFDSFAGTFNGNGKTVKNAVISDDSKALLAQSVTNGAVVKNVVFEGITMTKTHPVASNESTEKVASESGYAIVVGSATGSITLENITVMESDMTLSSSKYTYNNGESEATAYYHSSAVLLGAVSGSGTVMLKDCTLQKASAALGIMSGGLVGAVSGAVKLNIEGCSVTGGTIKGSYGGIGAIIGKINNGPSVNIKDCTTSRVTVRWDDTEGVSADGYALAVGQVAANNTNGNVDLTVSGCTFGGAVNYSYKDRYAQLGAIVGSLYLGDGKTALFTDNTVDADISAARGYMGGLVGAFYPRGTAAINIDRCNLKGDIKTTGIYTWEAESHLGGLIGLTRPQTNGQKDDHGNALYYEVTGKSVISNTQSTAKVINGMPKSNSGAGGLIGSWGIVEAPNAENGLDGVFTMTTALSINNCYIGGEISRSTTEKAGGVAAGAQNSVGGVIGSYCAGGSTLDIDSVIIAAKYPKNSAALETAQGAGIIIGRSMRTGATVSVTNCSTTIKGVYYMMADISEATVNGKAVSEEGALVLYTDGSLISISDEQATAMRALDGNGYIINIVGHTDVVEAQRSEIKDGRYNLRFVVPTLVKGVSAGMTVTVKNARGRVLRTFSTDSCEIYNELTGDKGIEAYKTSDYADRFFAYSILNIPTGEGYSFEATPYYTVKDTDIKIFGKTFNIMFTDAGETTDDLASLPFVSFGPVMDWTDGDPRDYKTMQLNTSTEGVKILGERYAQSDEYIPVDWSCSGIELSIDSEGGTVEFAVQTLNNKGCYFRVFVDGAPYENTDGSVYFNIKGTSNIRITDLAAGTHTIRLIKVTGYTLCLAQILSVKYAGEILTAPADNSLYIEFIGDSISCGWGTIGEGGGLYTDQDGTLSYTYKIADAYNADYSITALSGQGLVKGSYCSISDGYKYASYGRDHTTEFAFERDADLVVINVGTNDAWIYEDSVTTESFKQAYKDLIDYIKEKNEGCKILCLYGAMVSGTNNDVDINQIATWISEEWGGADNGLYSLELDGPGSGQNLHPTASEQQAHTDAIKKFIDDNGLLVR